MAWQNETDGVGYGLRTLFFFNLQLWLSCLWTLEGERSTSVMIRRIRDSLPSVLMANWSLWLPAQCINFRFVPNKFQVLYSNVIALIWNVYLSYSQTQKQGHSPKDTAET